MSIGAVDSADFDEAFNEEYLASKDTNVDRLMGRWDVTLPDPGSHQVRQTYLVATIVFSTIGCIGIGCFYASSSVSFILPSVCVFSLAALSFLFFSYGQFDQDPVIVKEKVREFFQNISEKPDLQSLLGKLNKNPYFKNEQVRSFIFNTLRHVYLQELHDLSVAALLSKHGSALFVIFSEERDLDILERKLLREAFANRKLPNMVDLQAKYGAVNLAKIFKAETLIRLYNEPVMQLTYEEVIRNHIGKQTKQISYCRDGRPFLSLTDRWQARFSTDYLERVHKKEQGFQKLMERIRSDGVPFIFSEESLAKLCAGKDLVHLQSGTLLLRDFLKKHGDKALGALKCTPEEKAAIRSSFYENELPSSFAIFYKEYLKYSSQLQLIGCRIEDFRSRFLIFETDTYQNIMSRFGGAAFASFLEGKSLITESYRQKLARDQLAAWNGYSFIDLKNAPSEVRFHLKISLEAMAQACVDSDCTANMHYHTFRDKHSVEVLPLLSRTQQCIIKSVFTSFVERLMQDDHTWADFERRYEKDLGSLLTKREQEALYEKCLGNFLDYIRFNSYRESGAVYEAFVRKFGDEFFNSLSKNQTKQLQPYFSAYLKGQIDQKYGYSARKGDQEGYLSIERKYKSLCEVFSISNFVLLKMVMPHEVDQLTTFGEFERRNGLENICLYLSLGTSRGHREVKHCFLDQPYPIFSQDKYQKLREVLFVRHEDQERVLRAKAKNLNVRQFVHEHTRFALGFLSSIERYTYLNQLIRGYDRSDFSYKDYENDLPILRALGYGELEKEEIFSFIFKPQSDVRKFMRELDERELPKSPSFRSQLVEKFTAVLVAVPHNTWTDKERSLVNLLAPKDFNLYFTRAAKLLQVNPCNQELVSLWNALKGTNKAESFKKQFLETLVKNGPFESMMNSYPLSFLQEMISEGHPMFQELKKKSVAIIGVRLGGQETPFMQKCRALGLWVVEPQPVASKSNVDGKRKETPSMIAALNQLQEKDKQRVKELLESCRISTDFARAGQTYTSQEHGLASTAFVGIRTEREQEIVLLALGFSLARAKSLIEDIRELDDTYLEDQ